MKKIEQHHQVSLQKKKSAEENSKKIFCTGSAS
jgi:hypothetical protein